MITNLNSAHSLETCVSVIKKECCLDLLLIYNMQILKIILWDVRNTN